MKYFKGLRKEFISDRILYSLLLLVIIIALILRVYRIEDLLGFYYDQGRDALVVWHLWHSGKLFLIGPVSGLAGIFLGPLYYYLITPFYILGGGDPRFPAFFLALLSVLALPVIYVIGKQMESRLAGFLAVFIASFSYYLILAGRWLSNPTPILFSSTLLLFCMCQITVEKSKKDFWWILVALLLGISLQFESASAVFYLPMIAVFGLWQRKRLPTFKIFLMGCFIFLVSVFPQILFNFRHENIIVKSFERVLVQEKSFRNPLNKENIAFKKEYFCTVLNSKIFPSDNKYTPVFYGSAVIGIFSFFKKNRKGFFTLAIFLGIPAVCYIFFQGNEGHIYDYYLTGYYMPMVLLFSVGIVAISNNILGKLILIWFVFIFLIINGTHVKDFLTSPAGGPVGITLGTEKAAVDWVYGNAAVFDKINVDVYVPPVIPHSYDYLFLWRGSKKCGEDLCGLVYDEKVPALYTLYEDDPQHPERLTAWLERQKNIGEVEEQIRFGKVTVQRRKRI